MRFDFFKHWSRKSLMAVTVGATLVALPYETYAEDGEKVIDAEIETVDNNMKEEKKTDRQDANSSISTVENDLGILINESRSDNFVFIPERYADSVNNAVCEKVPQGPFNPDYKNITGIAADRTITTGRENLLENGDDSDRGKISQNVKNGTDDSSQGNISKNVPHKQYESGRGDISGNAPYRPYNPGRGDISGNAPHRPHDPNRGDISGNAPRQSDDPGRGDISGNAPHRPYDPGRGDISGNAPHRPYDSGQGDISGNAPRRPHDPDRGDVSGNAPHRPYRPGRENRSTYAETIPSQNQYINNRKELKSSAAPSIVNNVISTVNGTVSLSTNNPKAGETVRIKAIPEKGYKIDKIIIIDSNGKLIRVKKNGEGSYSFVQPATKVIIWVTFKKI